jgi:hypothetical protein
MVKLPEQTEFQLRKLIGINIPIAKELFLNYGIKSKSFTKLRNSDGFTENLIAILLDESLPTSKLGRDFIDFESKQIKLRQLVRTPDFRTKGDTPISKFDKDMKFYESNIWQKTKSLLCVCVYDDTITDVRYFDGESHKSVMANDWKLIKSNKNSETKILTYKKNWNSIMIKKNNSLFLSKSISNGVDNKITDQVEYCNNLFFNKLESRKDELARHGNSNVKRFERILNSQNTTLDNMETMLKMLQDQIEVAKGYKDINDDTLTF